ncbi:MAG TPA: hypothetical protein VNJ52_10490 [Patescibacteria group bacterium]|nr:hypothetical protein [Patescibacteria group bacterium]
MLFVLAESVLLAIAIGVALERPETGSRWFDFIETKLAPLARRRRLAVLLVGLLALAGRAAVLPILPVPVPRIDDEFCYMLAGQTFARGRLTNPTPPMWQHFETFAQLMRPTYQCEAPPAQGVVLAFGDVVAHQPFLGVWLSVGVMCAAICWMLQGWMAAEWAFLGGLILVLRWGVFSYWASSYWGGAVAATGGALLLGALPRILKWAKPRDALFMGFGLAILANDRPYEGLVLSIPVALVLLIWLLRKRGAELWWVSRRVVLPLVLLLAATAAATGFYNWRVTGNPLQFPEIAYHKMYDPFPLFVWGKPAPVRRYREAALRDFVAYFEAPHLRRVESPTGFLDVNMRRLFDIWLPFLGPALFLMPFGVLIPASDDDGAPFGEWESRLLAAAAACLAVALAFEVYDAPHYGAPGLCVILALGLIGIRRLRGVRWRGRPTGLFISRAIPAVLALMFVLRAGAGTIYPPLVNGWTPAWYGLPSAQTPRSEILNRLEKMPGKQLVLVRYHEHNRPGPHGQGQWAHEWVYNGPDIEQQKVIWAWDMGAAENEKLIRAYPGRGVWLVDLAGTPPKLAPYHAGP